MSSSPESPRLGSRHRNTVRQIFEHPVSHNALDDWPLLGELAVPGAD